MPQVDKILEAEQIIQTVSQELKAMADAATLLRSASSDTKAVIGSSQKIIGEVDKFVASSRLIIERLEAADIAGRLNTLGGEITAFREEASKRSGELSAEIRQLKDAAEVAANQGRAGHKDLTDALAGFRKETATSFASLTRSSLEIRRYVLTFGLLIMAGLIAVLIRM